MEAGDGVALKFSESFALDTQNLVLLQVSREQVPAHFFIRRRFQVASSGGLGLGARPGLVDCRVQVPDVYSKSLH